MHHPNIILAQLNPTVGDIRGNASAILAAYAEAKEKRAMLVVCPELSLIGYPPEDLVLSPVFRVDAMKAARKIAAETNEVGLVFGTVWEESGSVYNAAIFAAEGRIQHMHFKMMLPNYGVFDEKRYFTPGHAAKVFEWNGMRLSLMICEDIWHLQQAQEAAKQHAEMIIVINASPFERGKLMARKKVVALAAQVAHAPIIYVNMVGGQDDVVFDGGSFVVSASGYVAAKAQQFEAVNMAVRSPLRIGANAADDGHAALAEDMEEQETLWRAMTLGLVDYVNKNGFKGVLLGLSGGIDSALSAAVAVDALGAERVRGVLLPSPYTSPESNEDALALAKNLGIHTDIIPITPMMDAAEKTLSALMTGVMENLAVGGNIQARIRGQLLMALSNQTGFMLLSTGNKSEIAVGYTTLYGDACGGFNVLKDLYKTEVYALANWRNNPTILIPNRTITKPPSAELKPNQKDSDQLPDYTLLDAILQGHLEGRLSQEQLVAKGFDEATVARVLAMVRGSEFKRRQSAPGVKLSAMLFGRDRRFPLTNRF